MCPERSYLRTRDECLARRARLRGAASGRWESDVEERRWALEEGPAVGADEEAKMLDLDPDPAPEAARVDDMPSCSRRA